MKKLFLILLLIGFGSSTFAKEKKSLAEKRAKAGTEFIASEMKLDAVKKDFVYRTLLARYNFNTEKIKGNNLSVEDKKLVYKESYKNFQNKLANEFNKKQIKRINDLIKEINNKEKEKKKK